MSYFGSFKPVLFIPSENLSDNKLFHTPSGFNEYFNGFEYYDKYGVFKASYVELNEDQFNTIVQYTTNAGTSKEALISLIIGDPSGTEYTFNGNFLILPEYTNEVLELVKDNPRKVITDPYQLIQIKE